MARNPRPRPCHHVWVEVHHAPDEWVPVPHVSYACTNCDARS